MLGVGMYGLAWDSVYTLFAWTTLGIFFVATLFWLFEVLVLGRAPRGPVEHGPEDIEVRVMTVDAAAVVQGTVNALPDGFAAVRVVAERDIDVDGADVRTVPASFSCQATRKGRALEWARRNVESTAPYVLYLDEDTILQECPGLPDADVVQLSEQPVRSGSWVAYLAEIFRMGFQIEQAVFPRFRYPLYAWGGGFAVRRDLEDRVTWDVETVTEDTNFLWRAFQDPDVDLQFLNVRARNQAPPSVREMVHQRRRWISGAAADSQLLPLRYRLLSLLRNAAWGLVFVSPTLALPFVTPLSIVAFPVVYGYTVAFQLVGLFGWAFLGYWYYGERVRVLAALFLTIPVVAIVHAAGAFWAIFSPTSNFRITEKVAPEDIPDPRIDAELVGSEVGDDTEEPVPEQVVEPPRSR